MGQQAVVLYIKKRFCSQRSKTDSKSAIEKFKKSFARFGLPKTLVRDEASLFFSKDFSTCLFDNGIKHLTFPPHYPATNYIPENAIKVLNWP